MRKHKKISESFKTACLPFQYVDMHASLNTFQNLKDSIDSSNGVVRALEFENWLLEIMLKNNVYDFRTVLRVQLDIYPGFDWKDSVHGNSMKWHIWVEDLENEHVYHTEQWLLTKKMMREESQRLVFTIPIFEPLPTQYFIR